MNICIWGVPYLGIQTFFCIGKRWGATAQAHGHPTSNPRADERVSPARAPRSHGTAAAPDLSQCFDAADADGVGVLRRDELREPWEMGSKELLVHDRML